MSLRHSCHIGSAKYTWMCEMLVWCDDYVVSEDTRDRIGSLRDQLGLTVSLESIHWSPLYNRSYWRNIITFSANVDQHCNNCHRKCNFIWEKTSKTDIKDLTCCQQHFRRIIFLTAIAVLTTSMTHDQLTIKLVMYSQLCTARLVLGWICRHVYLAFAFLEVARRCDDAVLVYLWLWRWLWRPKSDAHTLLQMWQVCTVTIDLGQLSLPSLWGK